MKMKFALLALAVVGSTTMLSSAGQAQSAVKVGTLRCNV